MPVALYRQPRSTLGVRVDFGERSVTLESMSEFGPGYVPEEVERESHGSSDPEVIDAEFVEEPQSPEGTFPHQASELHGARSEPDHAGLVRTEQTEAVHSPEATEAANEIIGELNELFDRQQDFRRRIEDEYDNRSRTRLENDDSDRAHISAMLEIGMNQARAAEMAEIPQIVKAWEGAHAAWESGQYDRLSAEELSKLRSAFKEFSAVLRAKQDVIERYVAAQERGATFFEAIREFGSLDDFKEVFSNRYET